VVEYSHGGSDSAYLYPRKEQNGFNIKHLTGRTFLVTRDLAVPEYYSTYGSPIPEIQLISEIVKEIMVFNIPKYGDPDGETVVIALEEKIVKDILVIEKEKNYKLSGKTGGGEISNNKYIMWLVGYLEKE